IVWRPQILSPKANFSWVAGAKHNVTWKTSDIPNEKRQAVGEILLGHKGNSSENLDLKHPLAKGFPLSRGWVTCQLPANVVPRNDYFVILFGDSGNSSPIFTVSTGTNHTTHL
ncbi:hypothetical protein C8J56DRAFT_768118, partial [Mycena floridula]